MGKACFRSALNWAAIPILAAAPTVAWGQAATIGTATLGTVAADANGVTTFQFTPTGAVSRLSGDGVRISAGAVVFPVTVTCTNSWCGSQNVLVKVASTGTPTGRAGSLTNFTAQMGTAKLVTGGTVTGTNPITFTLKPIGNGSSVTFSLGADFPIKGDETAGTTGAASSAISITVSKANGSSAVTSGGMATANVYRALSMSSSSNLEFGRFVRPATGSGAIAMTATTGALSVGAGIGLSTPVRSRAAFTVTGEGDQTIAVTVPTTITLTDAALHTLTITTSNTAQGVQQLSTGGSLTFYVGGSFPISSTTPTGAYTATFTVTAAYN